MADSSDGQRRGSHNKKSVTINDNARRAAAAAARLPCCLPPCISSQNRTYSQHDDSVHIVRLNQVAVMHLRIVKLLCALCTYNLILLSHQ